MKRLCAVSNIEKAFDDVDPYYKIELSSERETGARKTGLGTCQKLMYFIEQVYELTLKFQRLHMSLQMVFWMMLVMCITL